ncbi:hypothetical protein [Dietzia sp.]|uniref:hypothetical protein n=1 Tax=Dietzia sp. TaxID=1871616 RepID=UPI002FDB450C
MSTHLRVRIDSAGVAWAFGFGFPRGTIALADIVSAESTAIHPLEHGGWGHRIRPAGTGIIVRSGPGILLRLRSGRKVAISVSQRDEAVETLHQLLSTDGDGPTIRQ